MNNTQKRDIHYTFVNVLQNPVHSQVIDDQWRKERFQNLDIILPNRITQFHLNNDQNETDPFSGSASNKDGGMVGPGGQNIAIMAGSKTNVPVREARRWDDLGLTDLITK